MKKDGQPKRKREGNIRKKTEYGNRKTGEKYRNFKQATPCKLKRRSEFKLLITLSFSYFLYFFFF